MGWVASTGTYSPKSLVVGASVKSITIGVYENGLLKSLKGAVGTAKITFVYGMPIKADFTFIGCWVAPSDAAILTPTYETTVPPRFAGVTFTARAAAARSRFAIASPSSAAVISCGALSIAPS